MAANKFATMVSKNTNKITLTLIYAGLEWTLILLLLLNSLFSYLVIKFADYFGLKPPCLWCSRIDHILEPNKKNNNYHRYLLCEFHSEEVSKLGFCSNHQKLAKSKDMCEDCSSSRPDFDFLELVKEMGMIINDADKVFEHGDEVNLKCCSCCGVNLDNHVYSSSYILLKPSWDVLEYPQKIENQYDSVIKSDQDQILADGKDDEIDEKEQKVSKKEKEFTVEDKSPERVMKDLANDQCENVIKNEEEEDQILAEVEKVEKVLEKEEREFKRVMKDESVQVCIEEEEDVSSFEILHPHQHLEFYFDCTGNRLVPAELIDLATEDNNQSRHYGINEEEKLRNADDSVLESMEIAAETTFREPEISNHMVEEKEDKYAVLESMEEMAAGEIYRELEPESALSRENVEEEERKYAVLESMEMEEDENSFGFHAQPQDSDDFGAMEGAELEENNQGFTQAMEDGNQVNANETDAEVSIGTEIPNLDATDDFQNEDIVFSHESNFEDPSTSSNGFHLDGGHGAEEDGQQTIELRSLSLELNEDVWGMIQSSFSEELNGNEEEKVPDTPISADSLNSLHKKLMLRKKKDSGTEDSLDGSMISEMEGGDGVIVSVESLKSSLRNERKALQALYSELEEERSASAVAANQTMAMINRLQEEKAQMQMEALQYQRMMEEQSEYDQEALQLLNELMVKREKEKHELEKELEIYRRRVLEFNTKEKMRILRSKDGSSARSGFSSTSCSNAEDSDGISIDLNQEAKEEKGYYSHQECSNNNNIPVDGVLNLEESLADFEEERISILEQLKSLEEKLMTLDDEDDEEEQHFEGINPEPHFNEENGNRVKENGHANGYSKEYHQDRRRIIVSKGKSLLPLFDATTDDDENGDIILNGNGNGFDSNGAMHNDSVVKDLEMENKTLDIEEEVDHLYERLQALEGDREFLKHCISSLKKGDKGMDLLQEILQHLRDLRNVELRAKNFSDSTPI